MADVWWCDHDYCLRPKQNFLGVLVYEENMKYVPNIRDYQLTSNFGQPVVNDSGEPVLMSTRRLLETLMSDPNFVSGKKGAEAILFVVEVDRALKQIDWSQDKVGLENTHWNAFVDTCQNPAQEFDMRLALSLASVVKSLV